MSMRKRMAKGLAAILYGRAAMLVGQLVQVPVLTAIWGVKVWGSWLVLTALASFLSYSSIGLTPVVRSETAMAFERGDQESMRQVLSTGLVFVGLGAALGFGIFAAIAGAGVSNHLFKDPVLAAPDVRFILLCLGAQIAINAVGGVLSASLSGRGAYAMCGVIDATRMLCEFFGLVFLVLVFHTQPNPAALLFPVLAAGSLAALAAFHLDKAYRPSLAAVSPGLLARLWRPMIGGLLVQFSYSALFIQAPRLILSRLIGPAAVAAYALAAYVVRPARMVTETVALMLPVEFAFAYGRGDLPLARRMLSTSVMLGLITAAAASGVLIVFGPWAISLLSLGAAPVQRLTIAYFCVSLFAAAFSLAGAEFLISINRTLMSALLLIGLGAPYLVLSYLLSGRFGVNGMAASAALLECGYAAAVLGVSARHLDTSLGAILGGVAQSPVPLLKQEAALALAKLRSRFG